MSLTAKQRNTMIFLQDYIDAHQACPSFDEIAHALQLQSKSGVHRLIVALEERGFIRRLPQRARAIEILRRVDGKLSAADRDALISAMDYRERREPPTQATLPPRTHYAARLDEWLTILASAGFRLIKTPHRAPPLHGARPSIPGAQGTENV